jgi:hypothetical protein
LRRGTHHLSVRVRHQRVPSIERRLRGQGAQLQIQAGHVHPLSLRVPSERRQQPSTQPSQIVVRLHYQNTWIA